MQLSAGKQSNYEPTMLFTESRPFVAAGVYVMTTTPDKTQNHDAVIAAFADYVARHL